MFIDKVELIVIAGKGGDGAATLLRNGQTSRGGPDGGNGGNGGSIYFQGSESCSDLRDYRLKKIFATNGVDGKNQKRHGKNAASLTFPLPFGTHIINTETHEIIEITDTQPILICRGGSGGRGNVEFKTAQNQTPRFAEKGAPGEVKILILELKLIADIGLIGLPNAGKSSILTQLTRATPKIGNYPFTTLEPNLGKMDAYTIADIPGLIEGASQGKGLGITFLKHIEKTKILIHCIDITLPDVTKAYQIVRQEFEKYNASLLTKTEIIVLNKTDFLTEKEVRSIFKNFKKNHTHVLLYSTLDPLCATKLRLKIIEVMKEEK